MTECLSGPLRLCTLSLSLPCCLVLFLSLSLYLSLPAPVIVSTVFGSVRLAAWSVSTSLTVVEASRIMMMPGVHFNLIELLTGSCNIGLYGCPDPL